MNKAQIRKIYLSKRQGLSQAMYDSLNQQLLEQFKQLDLTSISCIHLFLPIHRHKEPDTFLLRDWLRNNHPHITRVFPKADFAQHTMQNYIDDTRLELTINPLGIPEPVNGRSIAATTIDLVIAPLLAFDKQGYRVGYGQGFYDRFMAQCRPDAILVGLSLFEPVDTINDVNGFDCKMDACLTPDNIWRWNSLQTKSNS